MIVELNSLVQWHMRRAAPVALVVLTTLLISATVTTYFFLVVPERAELERLQMEVAKPLLATPKSPLSVPARSSLEAFPKMSTLPETLRAIYAAAAEQGLLIEAGAYRLKHEDDIRLATYEIELPLKASYPQIRSFLAQLLRDHPTLALASASFERQQANDPIVQAKFQLKLHLSTELQ